MKLLILYLGIMFLGYLLGKFFIPKEKNYNWITKLTTICVVVLIFIMGARIGSDKNVVASLNTIGFQSFVLTIISFCGSILGVFIVRKFFKIDKRGLKK